MEDYKPRFDVEALNHPLSMYTVEKKIEAVSLYMLYGNMQKVSKLTGINYEVLGKWKRRSPWWDGVYQEIKKAKNDELQGEMTQVLDLAMEALKDRIQNGNEFYTKDGHQRVKVSAREAATVVGIMVDKRQLLRGEPNSIKLQNEVKVEDLKSQFEAFAKELRNEKVVGSSH